MLRVQDVVVDPDERRAWRSGEEIRLSRKEFDLLHALISRPGQIVSRDVLMLEVWQTTFWTSVKTIDVHLGWLRRKLGDDPRHPTLITTIRGRGLRFEESSAGTVTDISSTGAAPSAASELPHAAAAIAPEPENGQAASS